MASAPPQTEARSLTAVNNLASNPPQYPVNPTEEKQEPLTLYIARVPGTRDIILSPLKPQSRNITDKDIECCLYYVHLEAPPSDFPEPPSIRDDGHGSSSDENSIRTIPRKPVAGSNLPTPVTPAQHSELPLHTSLAPGDGSGVAPRQRGHTINSSYDSGRPNLSVPATAQRRSFDELSRDTTPVPVIQSPIARKPVGPRLMPGSSPSQQPPSLGNDPHQPDVFDRVSARNTGPPNPHAAAAAAAPNDIGRSPSPKKEVRRPNPFSLALIRRDPSTGHQWNVGRVSSYQSDEPAPDFHDNGPLFHPVPPVAPSATAAANPPINIHIETLGYGKFRNMPMRKSFDVGPGEGLSTPGGDPPPRFDGAVLTRQVVMSYGKSWASNVREKKKHRRNNSEQGGSEFAPGHRRDDSSGSVESTGSAGVPEPYMVLGEPRPGMKPRGYVFTSPWNGRCEFRTGTTGRSVKCYHFLNDDAPQPGGIQTAGMALSELRFSLPSVDLFKSPEGREEVKNQLQGHFNKLLRRDGPTGHFSDDDDDGLTSPFNVNLGKEKAGGGKRGRRAKLGKLIIYNDGLKMLDLVVAANMGVWWGAWEKSF